MKTIRKAIAFLLVICFVGSVTLEPVMAAPGENPDLNLDGKISLDELAAAKASLDKAYSDFDFFLKKAKSDASWSPDSAVSRDVVESERQRVLAEEARFNRVAKQAAADGVKIPGGGALGSLTGVFGGGILGLIVGAGSILGAAATQNVVAVLIFAAGAGIIGAAVGAIVGGLVVGLASSYLYPAKKPETVASKVKSLDEYMSEITSGNAGAIATPSAATTPASGTVEQNKGPDY